MDNVVLKASRREVFGKNVKNLRREGKLPAVLYGKGIESVPILLDLKDASKVLRGISSSSLLTVDVDGEQHPTLVRERQRDFIKGDLLHVDFQVVSLTETVRAAVNVILEGEAPAVKNFGGLLVTGLDQVEVESLPQELPERVLVDVSALENIGDSLYVRDLVLPPDVEMLSDLDELVVVVTAPAMVEEEEVEEEAVLDEAEPEVIEKGKAEDEGGEGEEA